LLQPSRPRHERRSRLRNHSSRLHPRNRDNLLKLHKADAAVAAVVDVAVADAVALGMSL
jgi:hypothetical protein